MLQKVVLIEFVFLVCAASFGNLANSIQSQITESILASKPDMVMSKDDFADPSFAFSRLAPRGDKRKASDDMSNISSPARLHKVGSGSASQQIQSKKSPSPNPASSGSISKSSKWNGSGFTDSDSPSSWGSWHSDPPHPPTSAKILAKGSAVVRTRTMASKRRDFSEIDSMTTGAKGVQDPQKTQAAVHVLSQKGNAHIAGVGKYTVVKVDARKSKYGGWVGGVSSSGQTDDVVRVPPGTKAKYTVQYPNVRQENGARGFVQGKGTVKLDSNNVWPSHIEQSGLMVDSPTTSAASDSDYGVGSDSESISRSH